MTIIEFLLARVAEDEAVARAASDGRWYVELSPSSLAQGNADVLTAGTTAPSFFVAYDETFGACSDEDAAHIARHDPARVLAECAAKRVIVVQMQSVMDDPWSYDMMARDLADDVLRELAKPFAGHPDYDPDWRA